MKSIEVKIPKEIREYREAIFFGLTGRQLVCSLLALGAAVGLYFLLRPVAGDAEIGWICILGAAPFALCGFFRYHGMTAEQFAWAWIKSELLSPKCLVFRSNSVYYELLFPPAETENVQRQAERRGAVDQNACQSAKSGA